MEALIPEETVSILWKRIPRHIRITFIVCLSVGVLTHGFILTNKLINHDEATSFFSLGATVTSGRWALTLLQERIPLLNVSLAEPFSMPWVNGLLSIFYIAFAACFTVSKLGLKNDVTSALCGASMVVFPTVACTFSYMFTAPAYFLSLLMAAAAAYFADRGKLGWISSAVMLCFSLGIYQAYYPFAAALFVIRLALDMLDGEDAKTVFWHGIKYVGILAISMALYFIVNKMALSFTGAILSGYQGIDEMGRFALSTLPSMLWELIRITGSFFILVPMQMSLLRLIEYIVLLSGSAWMCIELLRNGLKRSWRDTLLMILLAVMIPISIGLVAFMGDFYTHAVMAYPLVLYTILPLCLFERYGGRFRERMDDPVFRKTRKRGSLIAYYGTAAALLMLLYNFILIDNEAYMKLYISYEEAYAYGCRVAARVENTPGYTPDTTVAVIGEFDLPTDAAYKASPNYEDMMSEAVIQERILNVLGSERDKELKSQFDQLDHMAGIISPETLLRNSNFLSFYCGLDYTPATLEQEKLISESGEYAEMPEYPQSGSVGFIGDVLVVKAESD